MAADRRLEIIENEPPQDSIALCADGALTIPDAVQFSGLSRSRIYELIAARKLPAIRFEGRRLIPRRALATLLANHMSPIDK